MTSTRWFSLRHRLLILLLGGVSSILLIALLLSYQHAHDEVDALFDAQLAQVAQSLITQANHELGHDPHELQEFAHRYQRDTRFQLLDRTGKLLQASEGAPIALHGTNDGFSESKLEGIRWRHFSQRDKTRGLRVIVSENHQIRETLTNSIVLRMMLPAILGLPLIGLWVWAATRHGLKSLDQVAEEIAQKAPNQLAAVRPDQAPKEIRPLLTAINQLLARIEQAIESERRFTADAAHELRTPLAALQAQVDVALRARDQAEARHAMLQLQAGLHRAKHLIEQLLQLARLDPESGLPTPRQVDLRQITESVCAELGSQILEKNLEFDFPAGEPCYVIGQEDWLRVLIRNLVENATRYTPQAGRLHIQLTSQASSSTLTITDSGPGIPAEAREAVFHRFHRLAQTQDKAPGCGLGLSIVARIAELHGAELALSDAPEPPGLAVHLKFPIAEAT